VRLDCNIHRNIAALQSEFTSLAAAAKDSVGKLLDALKNASKIRGQNRSVTAEKSVIRYCSAQEMNCRMNITDYLRPESMAMDFAIFGEFGGKFFENHCPGCDGLSHFQCNRT
jgi:hypothetical protein